MGGLGAGPAADEGAPASHAVFERASQPVSPHNLCVASQPTCVFERASQPVIGGLGAGPEADEGAPPQVPDHGGGAQQVDPRGTLPRPETRNPKLETRADS